MLILLRLQLSRPIWPSFGQKCYEVFVFFLDEKVLPCLTLCGSGCLSYLLLCVASGQQLLEKGDLFQLRKQQKLMERLSSKSFKAEKSLKNRKFDEKLASYKIKKQDF